MKPTFQQVLLLVALLVIALLGSLHQPVPPTLALLIGVLCPTPANAAK